MPDLYGELAIRGKFILRTYLHGARISFAINPKEIKTGIFINWPLGKRQVKLKSIFQKIFGSSILFEIENYI
jgi:hypothetical protein